MINNKTILAVIPARIGSKRLPRKNILSLCGMPLVSWTINAAKGCKYVDNIFLSTDSQEIADIGFKSGLFVPFLRSKELSGDTALNSEVVLNTIYELERLGKTYDYVLILQPTSPLRSAEHITMAIEKLIKENHDAVISVCEAEHHPLWCNTLQEDGAMLNFINSDIHNKRSQNLPKYYRLNGAIYICDIIKFKEKKTFFLSSKCSAFIMPQEASVDIDTKIDFEYAKILLSNANSNA